MNITISVTFVTHWEIQVTGKTARKNIYLAFSLIASSFVLKFNKGRPPTTGFKRGIAI